MSWRSYWPRPWFHLGIEVDPSQSRVGLYLGIVGFSIGHVTASIRPKRGWWWLMIETTFGYWHGDYHYGYEATREEAQSDPG